MGMFNTHLHNGFCGWFVDRGIFHMGDLHMTNCEYVIHADNGIVLTVCKGYEAYLEYYRNEIKPSGFGTRYMKSVITRRKQFYHLELVKEGVT